MITVFGGGTSRSIRVTWLLEEMGIPYRIRFVDLFSGYKIALEKSRAVVVRR